MSSVTAVVEGLVEELNDAGITATADPTMVSSILVDVGMVALVGPPTVVLSGLGLQMDLEVAIHLICRPPGGLADWELLWDALPAALVVCRAEALPTSLTLAGDSFPAYRILATRNAVAHELNQ